MAVGAAPPASARYEPVRASGHHGIWIGAIAREELEVFGAPAAFGARSARQGLEREAPDAWVVAVAKELLELRRVRAVLYGLERCSHCIEVQQISLCQIEEELGQVSVAQEASGDADGLWNEQRIVR